MPAQQLNENPKTVRRFDILATGANGLLEHAMLCDIASDRSDVTSSTELQVAHMGPPLRRQRSHTADAVGGTTLTEAQARQIETYANERFEESRALHELAKMSGTPWNAEKQYRINPPSTPPNRDCSYWRFSCVGFALAAYGNAGLYLVSKNCPGKNLDEIKKLYPDERLSDPQFRSDMGIGEGTEWPIILAGYVMNALDRPVEDFHREDALPYEPIKGDEYFPSRRQG